MSPSGPGCGVNLSWSHFILAPMWLLITLGTGSEYQGRSCWVWRGSLPPSAIMHGMGINCEHTLASVLLCEGFTQETSSDTSACKKGHVRHKQDITPLQRLTEKAFTTRHKLHMFLVQKHLLSVQMPINSPAMGRSAARGVKEQRAAVTVTP